MKNVTNLISKLFTSKEKRRLEAERKAEDRQTQIATLVAQAREGSLHVQVNEIVLLMGERALWRETGNLVLPSVIGAPQSEGSLLKRFTTQLGIPELSKAPDPTSLGRGEFILTTQRMMFLAGPNTFIVQIENVAELYLLPDGLKFSEKGKSKIRAIKYDQPNGDIIAELVKVVWSRKT